MQIKQPILFLSGLQDEMVPPFHMQMLYGKAAAHNRECVFVDFPNGMHMDTWLAGGDHYWRTTQQFLEKHVPEIKEHDSSHDDKGDSFSSWNLMKLCLEKIPFHVIAKEKTGIWLYLMGWTLPLDLGFSSLLLLHHLMLTFARPMVWIFSLHERACKISLAFPFLLRLMTITANFL